MVYFVELNILECRGVFEVKKLAVICAFTVLILAGCGLGDSDNNGSSTINDDQQSGYKNNRDSKSSISKIKQKIISRTHNKIPIRIDTMLKFG